jgi:hypothetical protein
MNPYTILGAVAILIATHGATAWWSIGVGRDGEIAKQADAEKVRRETVEAAQLGAAKAIAKLEIKNVTIRQAIQREIVEKPVFRDCRSGDAAVRLLNAAAGHELAASTPGGGQLPGAARAD